MTTASLLQSLFGHKAWADDELLTAVARLDPAAQAAERHTAIRILNHIHVVDRLFEARLTGQALPYTATNTAETPALDALRESTLATDHRYLQLLASLSADALAERIGFHFTDGDHGTMSREEMLLHVVMHGGYHRGAVGRILAQQQIAPPRDLYTGFLHRTQPERRAPAADAAAPQA